MTYDQAVTVKLRAEGVLRGEIDERDLSDGRWRLVGPEMVERAKDGTFEVTLSREEQGDELGSLASALPVTRQDFVDRQSRWILEKVDHFTPPGHPNREEFQAGAARMIEALNGRPVAGTVVHVSCDLCGWGMEVDGAEAVAAAEQSKQHYRAAHADFETAAIAISNLDLARLDESDRRLLAELLGCSYERQDPPSDALKRAVRLILDLDEEALRKLAKLYGSVMQRRGYDMLVLED